MILVCWMLEISSDKSPMHQVCDIDLRRWSPPLGRDFIPKPNGQSKLGLPFTFDSASQFPKSSGVIAKPFALRYLRWGILDRLGLHGVEHRDRYRLQK